MNELSLVHLFHILIVGSLFLYVGINKTTIPKIMFPMLLGLGIIIILYHIYKAYNNIQHKKGFWANLIHIILVGPLLIYIGYHGAKTSRLYFELLLMLGFAAIGYHGYYMIY
jgi:Na+-transporting methylmalonyl-CoA/oxaloacetate decarboxylase beta subunit